MPKLSSLMCDDSMKRPVYVQCVMGVKNVMPADEAIFDFYIETLKGLALMRSGALPELDRHN